MKKIIEYCKEIYKFITEKIWRLPAEKQDKNFLIKFIMVIYLAINRYIKDELAVRASALTYYTVFAVVPFLCLIIGIGKYFGVQHYIESELVILFPGQEGMLVHAFEIVNSYLMQIHGGFILIAVILLLWTLYGVLTQIEIAFNNIWCVHKNRKIYYRIGGLLLMMVLFPIFLFVSSVTSIYINTALSSLNIFLKPVWNNILELFPLFINILLLLILYLIMPKTKVRFVPAFIGALLAGVVLAVFQQLYISGQIWVAHYNAIYGSFAAIPLLLLWIQFSWMIILVGAELSHCIQNRHNLGKEVVADNK
ncbi:MAG: YihY/virulence factor BrkB family protein [Bacteroidia bacterium]|nr:YihY/virulence factor BrkB family protein [Bacteroidia bacterium]